MTTGLTHELSVSVEGDTARLAFGKKSVELPAKGRGMLVAVAALVKQPQAISSLHVEVKNTSFSTTRQLLTMLNVLAAQLGITVNGKKQLSPQYDREPNITMPKQRGV